MVETRFPFRRSAPSRSCTECARRKIRCDHTYPCSACMRRGNPALCMPPDLIQDQAARLASSLAYVDRHKLALQHQIATLEARLGEPSSIKRSIDAGTYPEELLLMLESVSLGQPSTSKAVSDNKIAPLYQPAGPVFLMHIPDRKSSDRLIKFALENLTWVHCAVRTKVFQKEHAAFWEAIEANEINDYANDHGWLSIYFSLLAVAFLYMPPEQRPVLPHLSDRGETSSRSTIQNRCASTISLSTIWYQSAIKELEASSPLAIASLKTVQAVALLTLIHNHFGEVEQEYILLGMAINVARALDMHLLASEDCFSQRLASKENWSTPEKRQFGRRLWWTLVICDWLGMFTHPSSISPSSFNTVLSPHISDRVDLFLETPTLEMVEMTPLQYQIAMSQLASIVYTHVKAPRDPSLSRFAEAFDKLDYIERAMPYTSMGLPEWAANQQYLVSQMTHLIFTTISRAALVLWLMDKPNMEPIIERGLGSAKMILSMRYRNIPRLCQSHWIVSAASLAAGVYLAAHLICFKDLIPSTMADEHRKSIQDCLEVLKYLNPGTPLVTRGAHMIQRLLLIEHHSSNSTNIAKDKGSMIYLLKLAFQTDESTPDTTSSTLVSQWTADHIPMGIPETVDLGWSGLLNDLDFDGFLPNLDWDQFIGTIHN